MTPITADVTAVIPAHNPGPDLIRALQSCLAQTRRPRQVVVVDDGSTDGAIASAQAWWAAQNGERPELLVVCQANAGPAAARNRGWDMAQGALVAFLDADDAWAPEKIERICEAWRRLESPIAIGHRHAVAGTPPPPTTGRIHRVSLLRAIVRNPFVTPSLVVSRDAPMRFDPSFRHTEDHELIVRLVAAGAVYVLDDVLAMLQRPPLAPGGLSSNRLAMRRGEMRMYASLARVRWWLAPLVPALLAFSTLKHLRAAIYQSTGAAR